MDWGVFPHEDKDKGDAILTRWAVDQIKQQPRDKPFFLSIGYFLPHVPCYTTQRWYDLYPDSDQLLPKVNPHDRDDIPRFAWYLHWYLPEPRLRWLQEQNQWRNLARSYLACISFVDHQVGELLQALKTSNHDQDTLVILWSDHGWHLGEKQITGKNTLWERSTHVPLIFAGPSIPENSICDQPVELLDLYPTLIDLCQLPPRTDLEGHSLQPQLKDAQATRPWPAITSHNQGNHTIRSQHWRYIRYADGSEELYDHRTDPNEWHNLASQKELAIVKEHAAVIAEHRRWLPTVDNPPAPGSAHRVLTYNPLTRETVWEGKPILPDAPVPED
ncbi:MAG: sulfatase-like hydrolase/transferase [Planctomycetales bacterium]